MESVNPAGLESLEGVDARQLKALIRERLELKGEPDATPKLVRRYIEQQQHLQRGALDPIRKLVNKLTKEVLSEGLKTAVAGEELPSKQRRRGRSKKAVQKVAKRAQRRSVSPVRKTSSPYYSMLRRLCFASSINCNRLGLGGKDLLEKLRIIKAALAEKGYDESQLSSQNLSETLEMAEIEKDRRELEEASARVSGRRHRSTESYAEFFSGSERGESDEDTSGDADDESDDVSTFEVDSDMSDDDQNEGSDYYQDLKENVKPKKRQSTKKKSATKKRTKKAKLVAAEEVEMKSGSGSMDLSPRRGRKRKPVRYAESEEEDDAEQSWAGKRRKARGSSSDQEEQFEPTDSDEE